MVDSRLGECDVGTGWREDLPALFRERQLSDSMYSGRLFSGKRAEMPDRRTILKKGAKTRFARGERSYAMANAG